MIRRPAVEPRQRRAVGAPLAVVLAAGLLTGCITTYEPVDLSDPDSELIVQQPVAIPIGDFGGGKQNRLLLEFYSGILRRLHDEAAELVEVCVPGHHPHPR